MDENKIEKLVAETLDSFNGSRRAEPKPYLLGRVMASTRRRDANNSLWTAITIFLSKPGIALAGLTVFIIVNTGIILSIIKNENNTSDVQQSATLVRNELAIDAYSLFETETWNHDD